MLEFSADPSALRADVVRRVVDLHRIVREKIRTSVHLPSVSASTARGTGYVLENMRALPDRLAGEVPGRPGRGGPLPRASG